MVCYALQGLSVGTPSMIVSAARQVVILLPIAYFLGKAMGVTGVWWAFSITELIVMIMAVIILKRTIIKLMPSKQEL